MPRIAKLDISKLTIETITAIDFTPKRVFGKYGKLVVVGDNKLVFYDPKTNAVTEKTFNELGIDSVVDVGIGISGTKVVVFDENGIVNSYDVGFTPNWASKGGGQLAIVGKGKITVCNEDLTGCSSLDVDPNAEFKHVYCNELGYCVAWAPAHKQTYHNNQYTGPDWIIIKNKSIHWYIYFGFFSNKYSLPTIPLDKYVATVYEQNNYRTTIEIRNMETKEVEHRYYENMSYSAKGYSICSSQACIANFDKAILAVKRGEWKTRKLSRSILSGSIIDSELSYILTVDYNGKGYLVIAGQEVEEKDVEIEFGGDIFIPLRV